MSGQRLEFIGDKMYVYTDLPQRGEGICTASLVMTKEMFQRCYKKWIVPQAESKEIKRYDVGKLYNFGVELCVTRVYKAIGAIFLDLVSRKGITYSNIGSDEFERTGHIESLDKWLEGE